ncbi:MAG TPA: succinylglutamate desuccinylase, partial [Halanaerobiales bacterium]|nr:succinylglutamate desuccinylase [Halanaerobiales bacterium]
MSDKKIRIIKYSTLALVIVAMIISGLKFYNHRNYKEPVILGPGVTKVETIGDYYEPVKGTVNDCNIYILDSGK